MGRHCKSGISKTQRHQSQLVKIEKILKELLGKVNESINALKVEELQLQSDAISKLGTNNSKEKHISHMHLDCYDTVLHATSPTQLNTNVINKQFINLNLLSTYLQNGFEEDDLAENE